MSESKALVDLKGQAIQLSRKAALPIYVKVVKNRLAVVLP
jgi:hypothetical protein